MSIAKLTGIGDKLSGIQGKLDFISDSFENPIESFAEELLGGIDLGDFGLELPSAIGDVLGSVPAFPKLELGLDKLAGFGDCFRNLDDIIIEYLQELVMEIMLSIPPGLAAAALMSTISSVIKVVQEVVDDVIALTELSLRDLIILAQNSSFLQRIIIINKITKLYGKFLCNIQDLIAQLMDLDPCNLLVPNYRPDGPTPEPGTMPDGPPPPPPAIVDPAVTNGTLMAISERFKDAKFNIGQALSKTGNDDPDVPAFKQSPSHNSALTQLHHLAHTFRNQITRLGNGNASRVLRDLQASKDRIVREKVAEWNEDALEWFEKKFEKHLLPTLEESGEALDNFALAQSDPVRASGLGIRDLGQNEPLPAGDDPTGCGPKEPTIGDDGNPVSEPPLPGERVTPAIEIPPENTESWPETITIPEIGTGGSWWMTGTYTHLYAEQYVNKDGVKFSYAELQDVLAEAQLYPSGKIQPGPLPVKRPGGGDLTLPSGDGTTNPILFG